MKAKKKKLTSFNWIATSEGNLEPTWNEKNDTHNQGILGWVYQGSWNGAWYLPDLQQSKSYIKYQGQFTRDVKELLLTIVVSIEAPYQLFLSRQLKEMYKGQKNWHELDIIVRTCYRKKDQMRNVRMIIRIQNRSDSSSTVRCFNCTFIVSSYKKE